MDFDYNNEEFHMNHTDFNFDSLAQAIRQIQQAPIKQAFSFIDAMNELQNTAGTSASQLEAISQGLLNLLKPTIEDRLQQELAFDESRLILKKIAGYDVKNN